MAIGLAVVCIAVLFLPHTNPNSFDAKSNELKQVAKQNVEFAHEADQARHRVSWDAAHTKLVAAQKHHALLATDLPKLLRELDQLATSAAGKRLAARSEGVEQYIALRSRTRLSSEELASQLRAIQTLLPVCEKALKQKQIVLPCDADFQSQVADIHTLLSQAAEEVATDLRSLQSLAATAQAGTPADQTLAAVAEKHKAVRDAETLARQTAESQRQQQAADQLALDRRLASEKTQQDSKLAADQQVLDAKRKQDEAEQASRVADAKAKADEAERQVVDAEIARKKAADRQRRVAKFEAALPGQLSILSPFISKGKVHFVTGKGWEPGEPGPLSLEAIRQTGALKGDPASYYIIAGLARGPGCYNDRPQGSFPEKNFGSPLPVQEAQAFMREYGDLMVERGLLLP